MTPLRSETLPVREASDILLVRQLVREWATELGFSVLDQTKLLTAASELGRNTLIHGGGGTMLLESVVKNDRRGLRLTFEDKGPGIADLEQAMTNGFTTRCGPPHLPLPPHRGGERRGCRAAIRDEPGGSAAVQ